MTDSTRTAYIAGLRLLADVLETRDEVPVPYSGRDAGLLLMFFGDDAKDAMGAAARALPCRLHKHFRDDYFDLTGSLHGLQVHLTAYRNAVCERVVVGTETVTRTVLDPSVEVPLVEVTETVDVVRWDCHPLLAGATSNGGDGS